MEEEETILLGLLVGEKKRRKRLGFVREKEDEALFWWKKVSV